MGYNTSSTRRRANHGGQKRIDAGRSGTPARLEEVANTLRQSDALKPASQAALAELIEELSKTLNTQVVAPAEVTHLAESTAHLAEALHQRRNSGFLARARERPGARGYRRRGSALP